MENYPLVWSLFSIRHEPSELVAPENLRVVTTYMNRMSAERLGGVKVAIKGLLISGDQSSERIRRHVFLHLYEIELAHEPRLNPEFYVDGAWMTSEEYVTRCADQPCGLCLRLWANYAWMESDEERLILSA
jgi:hypothetical protein